MWHIDGSTWSSSSHIVTLTGCACCTCSVCCLPVLHYAIFPILLSLSAISCTTWITPAFPSLLREGKFGPLMFLWWCLWTIVLGGFSHFPRYCLCKNVLQLPWCFFNLLTFFWCNCGATYVLWVSHDESASLHHPYSVGMSPFFIAVRSEYYAVNPWHPIFSLNCYCISWNKNRRIFSSIFALISLYLAGH